MQELILKKELLSLKYCPQKQQCLTKKRGKEKMVPAHGFELWTY